MSNQRCTCGFTTFRQTRDTDVTQIFRWMQFSTEGSGFGSSPYGTGMGGAPEPWGLFPATKHTISRQLVCEACARTRSSKLLGSIAVFASYVDGGYLYIVAESEGGDYSVTFTGVETVVAPLVEVTNSPAIVIAATPDTVAATPMGVTTNTLFRAQLPSPEEAGTYTVGVTSPSFSDTINLPDIQLEPPAMHVNALSADLDGFPRIWLQDQSDAAIQASNGARAAIPLEYCSAVAEFDGRLGSFADQGWTAVGAAAGNFPLVEGGVVQVTTVAESYYEKTVVGLTGVTQVYARAKHRVTASGTGSIGDGLSFEALGAQDGFAHIGARYEARADSIQQTQLDVLATSAEFTGAGVGWNEAAVSAGGALYLNNERSTSGPYAHGIDATVAGDHQVVARVGDRTGGSVAGHIANYVVSGPGRFLRAGFKTYAAVSSPRLRLYLTSTVRPTIDSNIRLKIRYSNSPDQLDDLLAETTVAMGDPGSLQEAVIDLSGLDIGKPFWFTVERDAGVYDTMQATAFLHHMTVRSS